MKLKRVDETKGDQRREKKETNYSVRTVRHEDCIILISHPMIIAASATARTHSSVNSRGDSSKGCFVVKITGSSHS